jgi:AraC-like DNA-binding protein
MGFLYLDALGDDHAALRRIDPRRHAEAIRQAVTALWSVDDLCRALGLPPKPTPDARVAALLRVMDETPNAFARVQDAARFMGVSASRCRELLRSVAGVPFSRYRLWRRFALVVGEHCNARSLTEAAHRAGFASSAHLSVAFRRMFGLAPSALLRPGVSFDVA